MSKLGNQSYGGSLPPGSQNAGQSPGGPYSNLADE